MKTTRYLVTGSAVSAFTLVQLVAVIAVIGVFAGAAVSTLSNTSKSTALHKLKSDVRSLNAAVAVYRTFGGNLESAEDATQVLTKLQTKADAESAIQTAGITGSLVDRRLDVELQSEAEALSDAPRAMWDPDKKRFIVATSGDPGVARFVFNGDRAAGPAGTEVRDQNLKLAMNSGWIWDYDDSSGSSGTSPTQVVATGAGPSGGSGSPGGDGEPAPPIVGSNQTPLAPPVFSIPAGEYAPFTYDLLLTLSNPNPAGVSRIVYQVNGGGGWDVYTGGSITLVPGTVVSAFTESIDPADWLNSSAVHNTYIASTVYLEEPQVLTSATGFDYGANESIEVTINDPNNPLYSNLEYRINGGGWELYGGSFTLNGIDYYYPAEVLIEARAVVAAESYPEYYVDSTLASASIAPMPRPLSPPGINWTLISASSNPGIACPDDGLIAQYYWGNGRYQFQGGAYDDVVTVTPTAFQYNHPDRPIAVDFTSAVPVDRVLVSTGKAWETVNFNPPVNAGSVSTGDRRIRTLQFICDGNNNEHTGSAEFEVTLQNSNPEDSSTLRYKVVSRMEEHGDDYQVLPSGYDTDEFETYRGAFRISAADYSAGFGILAYADADHGGYKDSDVALSQRSPVLDISGTTDGAYHSPTGTSSLVTNLEAGESDSFFSWGTPASGYTTPSWMEITGASFEHVNEFERFYIGAIHYFNGTIVSGTGATSVELSLMLNFGEPQLTTFEFGLEMINTPNNTGTEEGDADYVKLYNVFAYTPITIFDRAFNLRIEFGSTSEHGFSTIDEFHVFENESASGNLYGTLELIE